MPRSKHRRQPGGKAVPASGPREAAPDTPRPGNSPLAAIPRQLQPAVPGSQRPIWCWLHARPDRGCCLQHDRQRVPPAGEQGRCGRSHLILATGAELHRSVPARRFCTSEPAASGGVQTQDALCGNAGFTGGLPDRAGHGTVVTSRSDDRQRDCLHPHRLFFRYGLLGITRPRVEDCAADHRQEQGTYGDEQHGH